VLELIEQSNKSDKAKQPYSVRLVASKQRIRPYLSKFLGIDTSLWCNSFNLPVSGVGSGSRRVMNTYLIRALVLTLEKFAMKKTLIALAAVAVSGAAFAQSTATISGGINVGVMATGAAGAAGDAVVSSLGGGANAINIITSEDLGGGLKGGFTAQMRFSAATGDMTSGSGGGTALFHAANAHISGGFGTVRVGKVAEAGNCGFDPWGCTGGAALQAGVGVSALAASGTQAHSIGYASPSISGFSIGYQTTMSTRTDERTVLNIGYTAGPLALSFVQADNSGASGADALTSTEAEQTSIAVGYTLGFGRITLVNTTTKAGGVTSGDVMSLGLSVPMGATTILAGYNKNSKAAADADTKFAIGMNYALSKRTTLGADLFKAEAAGAGTGFVARVRHTF
jgi:predicted porin